MARATGTIAPTARGPQTADAAADQAEHFGRRSREARLALEIAIYGLALLLIVSAALPSSVVAERVALATAAVLYVLFASVFFRVLPADLFGKHGFTVGAGIPQAIALGLLIATGGTDSRYFAHYVLPLIASGVGLHAHSTLWTGAIAVLGFAAVGLAEALTGGLSDIGRDLLVVRGLAIVAVVVVAVVAGERAAQLRHVLLRRSQQLAEQNTELETARSTTLALSRLHDRDEIIRAILHAAHRAIGAERAWLFIKAESEYRHGWTVDAEGVIERFVSDPTLRNPPRLRAVREQRTIVVNDTLREEGVSERARERYGLRAGIFVPLVHRGETVGIAAFSCSTPRQWSVQEIRLAETIAEGSAAAIATYLAFEELRVERERLAQRTRVLEGLGALSDALAISPNDDAAARAAARAIQQSFAFRAATVLFTDPSLALLEPRAAAGEATAHPIVQNPHTCPAVRSGHHFRVDSEATPVQCSYVPFRPGTNGLLCAPLVAAGQTVGAVFLEPTDASVLDESLVRAAADRVALHVANQRVLETAQRQAVTDGLTGLYNRHFMNEQLRLFHSLAERHGRTYSVVAFDLDGLKRVNDTFGHEAGDLALRAFANALRRGLRTEDVPVRTGGDEFVVILPDTPLGGAVLVAQRARDALEETARVQPQAAITVSAGVASWQAGRSAQDVLKAADAALYAAKRAGKDRVSSEAEPAEA